MGQIQALNVKIKQHKWRNTRFKRQRLQKNVSLRNNILMSRHITMKVSLRATIKQSIEFMAIIKLMIVLTLMRSSSIS